MMESMVVSSSLFSVYAVKKRVHSVSSPRKIARVGISVAKGLIGDQLCGKPASQASELMGCSCRQCDTARLNPGYKDGMVACLGVVDELEGKVFIVDATPDLRSQLWALQHQEGGINRPLKLGGILLTHAHTGHYVGLLQLGKEAADARDVPVFCTPSMASFLRHNQPWAQLVERGNVSIREVEPSDGTDPKSTRLTASVSFLPVPVPHRAELSDTVAYLITASRTRASTDIERSDLERPTGGTGDALRLFYCPDTDGWSGWKKSIQDWCKEVDVALVDATFYDKHELKGRDMSEVSHPVVQDTVKELEGCAAEVVLTHLNHTNPLLSKDSNERAMVLAKGFKVATFGMEWTLKQ